NQRPKREISAPKAEISRSYVLNLCVDCQGAAVRMFLRFLGLGIFAFEVSERYVQHACVGYSQWDFGRFPFLKNKKGIVSPESHKLSLWGVDPLIRQLKSPVVD